MVVPSPPFPALTKATLRRAAIDSRKAYVAALSDADRALLEQRLAERLSSLCAGPRWSPVIRRWAARSARCWRWRKRARSARSSPSRGLPIRPSAFASSPAIPRRRPVRDPPAQADRSSGRARRDPGAVDRDRWPRHPLGRGKGHYDRVLAPLRRKGALLIGVGWPIQRLTEEIPHDPWDVPMDGFVSPEVSSAFHVTPSWRKGAGIVVILLLIPLGRHSSQTWRQWSGNGLFSFRRHSI